MEFQRELALPPGFEFHVHPVNGVVQPNLLHALGRGEDPGLPDTGSLSRWQPNPDHSVLQVSERGVDELVRYDDRSTSAAAFPLIHQGQGAGELEGFFWLGGPCGFCGPCGEEEQTACQQH